MVNTIYLQVNNAGIALDTSDFNALAVFVDEKARRVRGQLEGLLEAQALIHEFGTLKNAIAAKEEDLEHLRTKMEILEQAWD